MLMDSSTFSDGLPSLDREKKRVNAKGFGSTIDANIIAQTKSLVAGINLKALSEARNTVRLSSEVSKALEVFKGPLIPEIDTGISAVAGMLASQAAAIDLGSGALEMFKGPLIPEIDTGISAVAGMLASQAAAIDLGSSALEMFKGPLIPEIDTGISAVAGALTSQIARIDWGISEIAGALTHQMAGINWGYVSGINSLISRLSVWDFPPVEFFEKAYRLRVRRAFESEKLWPVPSMSREFMEHMVVLYENGDRRPITVFVWNYYRHNDHRKLREALLSWWRIPAFAARRRMIESAFEAHRQGLYAVSIPALLMAIDGIAGDFVHDSPTPVTYLHDKSGTEKAAPLRDPGAKVEGLLRRGNPNPAHANNADVMYVAMLNSAISYTKYELYGFIAFEPNFEKIRKQQSLNRHTAFHGMQIDYDRAMNSLRCFLILDTFYCVLQQISSNSKQMHLPSLI